MSKAPLKILVTGFGRFPGAPSNPTTPLVARLVRAARRQGLDCVAHVFATRYAVVDRELPALIAKHRPDAIVMFGLAGRRRHVSIELVARNRVSTWFPDAGGAAPARAAIAAGAAASRRGRAAFSHLLAAARATRVRTRLSRDAGKYLCNYVYWRALEAAAQPDGPRRAVFIHVPPVGQSARPRARAKRHRFTPDEVFRAGKAILLAVSRR
jgi:pyroglutamyl-peptidase